MSGHLGAKYTDSSGCAHFDGEQFCEIRQRPLLRRSLPPCAMFRNTHTASAASLVAPVFRRKSPINRYSDSRGKRICNAICFEDAPEESPRSRIVSSAVNRGTAGPVFAVAAATGDAVGWARCWVPTGSPLRALTLATGRVAMADLRDAVGFTGEPASIDVSATTDAEVTIGAACSNSTDFICPRVAMTQSVPSKDPQSRPLRISSSPQGDYEANRPPCVAVR
jgi:hypothetical protein